MRRWISAVLCLVLCFVMSCCVSAASAQADRLIAQATVHEDGSCSVSISATVQFLSAEKEFILPLAKGAQDIRVSGASYDIDERNDVECVIFESSHGFSGKMTFVCSYTLPCVVTKADDGRQTVSLAIPEKGWAFPIKDYELTVSFPADIEAYPSWYSAYHGVDIENYLDIEIDGKTLHVKSLERFKDSETVSMQLVFAADTFNLTHQPGQTVSVATILFWLLTVCAVGYRFFRLRSKRHSPILRQTAVNESPAGEIPCQMFAAAPDAVGTLVHWGNLGYLTIRRNRNGRIFLRKQMEMGTERSASERKLFYSLFRNADTIDALEPRVLIVAKKVGVLVRKNWIRRLYRQDAGSPFLLRLIALAAAAVACTMSFDLMLPANVFRWILLPLLSLLGVFLSYLVQRACLKFYSRRRLSAMLAGVFSAVLLLCVSIGAGSFGTMLMSVVLQIFCAMTTMFGGVRKESAKLLVRQLLGLRAFLRTADAQSLERLSHSDSQYFYRMLPFAEQLGVASQFARRCGVLQPEPCPWLIDALSNPHTAPEFYTAYSQITAAIRKELSLSQPAAKPIPSEARHG